MSQIVVNGESRTWVPTLAVLLKELALEEAVVATAVNGDFVPVTARSTLVLEAGDRVEILAPMQGG